MAERITVALIDDDAAVLASTGQLLERQQMEVRAFGSAEEFLAVLDCLLAGLACIVSDVRMPGLSGLELIAELRRRSCRTPLVLITAHGDVRMAVRAIKAGATEFIEKPFEIAELADAIRGSAATARIAVKRARERELTAERAAQLSARQREVMDHVVEGYSSRQIGEKLGISPRTVETYRLQIMEKMGAGSVAALVRMSSLLTSDRFDE